MREIRRSRRRPGRLLLIAGTACSLILVAGLKIWSDYTSLPALPGARELSLSTVVLDRNDRLLRAFVSTDQKWRLPVALHDIDPLYVKMLLAYEDKRFFDHGGVDPKALLRAIQQAALSGRIVSGASTLTMQVARLLHEGSTKSLSAKYRQILHAVQLEKRLSKEDILSLYMLRAPFGGNLEGVRAASLAWFGKEPLRLTPAEAALLVALPQSPEARRPDRFTKRAREARGRVLKRAVAAGVLSKEDAQAALQDRLPVRRRSLPFLAAHKARDVLAKNPQKQLHRLTLDGALQGSLETLLLSKALGLGPKVSAAAIVADHKTGEILASVGSPGLIQENRQGHIDMTLAVRSPGSTLKPFIYGLAFEEGIAHPESFIQDRPIDIAGYRPTNFDRGYQGTVTVRQALQLSLNTPAVQLLEAVGPARLVARMKRAGVTPVLDGRKGPGLAIGLGGLGVSLTDLAGLYAGLAREGEPIALHYQQQIETAPFSATPVLEPVAAWHVADILTGLPQPKSEKSTPIAYKTGTSYGYRDSWAVGFDGRYVVAIWVGRADASPVPGLTGASAAAPILFETFQRIGKDRVALKARPNGVLSRPTAALPLPLRHARVLGNGSSIRETSEFRVAYPPNEATVELGLGNSGRATPLVVKLEGGRRPFTWLINNAPVSSPEHKRQLIWDKAMPGFTRIAVIDADGRTAQVSLTLR